MRSMHSMRLEPSLPMRRRMESEPTSAGARGSSFAPPGTLRGDPAAGGPPGAGAGGIGA